MSTGEIFTGTHGQYWWLTSTEDYDGTILRLCPEVVVDKFVAVTNVDGGRVRLTEAQIADGWRSIDEVAYSPRIQAVEEIPHQYDGPYCVGYDEMYVFAEPAELGQLVRGNVFTEEAEPRPGRVSVFAGYASFALHEPQAEPLVDLFWPQLLRLWPETYLADCHLCVTLVTRVSQLAEIVEKRLRRSHTRE